MLNLIKSNEQSKSIFYNYRDFKNCINDLLADEHVRSMENFMEHGNLTSLEHAVYVSYNSYLICRFLGLDYVSAARGGLLHDFYLYEWNISHSWIHYFTHPFTALKNANRYFCLNDIEQDIIVKHMWPLTLKFPKYIETFIVIAVDKICSFMELIKLIDRAKIFKYFSDLLNENTLTE